MSNAKEAEGRECYGRQVERVLAVEGCNSESLTEKVTFT